jgi:serine/threonine protein kinase
MPLFVAKKLGRYEILVPIGAGGKGEAYRALDPRLNRDVAIKVSAPQFSERFEREAKVIAVLNHPNIRQLLRRGPELSGDGFCRGTAGDGPLTLKSGDIVTERSGHEKE